MTDIRVSEIFGPTVQGEGALIGKPTVFVRTGGCDFRCTWCDTLYAVLPEYRHEWVSMTPQEIMVRVEQLSGKDPILVTLSGGSPQMVLKIVVFDDVDYDYARQVADTYPDLPADLQVGNHTPAEPNPSGPNGVDHSGILERFRWLVSKVASDRWFNAAVLPRPHVLAWGNDREV